MAGPSDLNQLVSILIPSNDTHFLSETLDSVFSQTYEKLEIVVVLNGPAVNELSDLQDRYENKVRFLTCYENGIVPSLNLGIANCLGSLIARIDADDIMPSKRIESQVSFLFSNPEVVCVGGQLEYISLNSDQKKHPGYPTHDSRIKHALYRFSASPHPGIMYRKDEVLSIGGYSSEFPFIEDWDLLFRLSKFHALANLDSTVVKYRVHSDQSTSKNSNLQKKSIRAFSKSILKYEFANFVKRDKLFENHRNLRRAIAGFLYVTKPNYKFPLFSKVQKLIFIILITSIDPRITFEHLRKKFTSTSA